MKLYVVCITHKRALNYIEVLKIFHVKESAIKYKNTFNFGRLHSIATLREYEVEDGCY